MLCRYNEMEVLGDSGELPYKFDELESEKWELKIEESESEFGEVEKTKREI